MEKTISTYAIPNTEQWSMVSAEGRDYRILTYIPGEQAPPEGYPVIYLLDGNALFGTVVEAVRLQSCRPGGADPAIVVGIGYPTDGPYDKAAREWDFTMECANEAMGGADAFLRFIAEELQPEIAASMPINGDKQALLGHELGGFFTLYALFKQPELFQTYIAGSPSLVHANDAVGSMETAFYEKLREWEEGGNLQFKSLLLCAGAKEEFEVIDAVRNMHIRLFEWQLSNFEVDLQLLLGENELTMLQPLISRGIAHFFE